MKRAIRIYVEGGGNSDSKAELRKSFDAFLSDVKQLAASRGVKWYLIACGGRDATLDNFRTALKIHPDAANFLLVDAEGPVTAAAKAHLGQRDNWSMAGIHDDQCHLMVQLMESWFLADIDALRNYYGQDFNASAIPRRNNIEEIPKPDVEKAMEASTRPTQKGRYHKIRHGSHILQRISAEKVCAAAPHCARLFDTLKAAIASGD